MIYGVVGQRKGGTSAVAGVLKILGVDMKYRDQGRLDDADLIMATRRGEVVVKRLIKERGYDWGFKHPLLEYDKVLPLLPRYKLIYVYRDPVAVIQHYKPEASSGQIKKHLEEMEYFTNLPLGLNVSYEKLFDRTEEQVARIAKYVGLPFNEKAVRWVKEGKNYNNIDKYVKEVPKEKSDFTFDEELT